MENFHNIIKDFRRQNKIDVLKFVLSFVPKIKLHGTNAGIYIPSVDNRIQGANIRPAKRTSFIETGDDNAGFAQWLTNNMQAFEDLTNLQDMIIWGEWAGPGVQKNVAISEIPLKTFFVIGVYVPGSDIFYWRHEVLRMMLKNLPVTIIEADYANGVNMDLCDVNSINAAIETINARVEACDECDPWVKQHYGIEGVGEGFVYYPWCNFDIGEGLHDIARFMFKAKGQKHSVNKQKKAVLLDAEKIAHANEFSNKFVTNARCNQALEHVDLDIKNMGAFLKWVSNDIIKESEDELEASGKDWKDVAKSVTMVASHWFKIRIKNAGN